MQSFMLQRCAYPACRISLQLLKVHKLLEKGLVTDGTGLFGEMWKLCLLAAIQYFQTKKDSLCYSVLPRYGTHKNQYN